MAENSCLRWLTTSLMRAVEPGHWPAELQCATKLFFVSFNGIWVGGGVRLKQRCQTGTQVWDVLSCGVSILAAFYGADYKCFENIVRYTLPLSSFVSVTAGCPITSIALF